MQQSKRARLANRKMRCCLRIFLAACAIAAFPVIFASRASAAEGDRSFAASVKAHAQFYFGVMLAGGFGVPRDPVKAAAWVNEAAEQGVAQAQDYLGRMYLKGHGVPQDNNVGIVWLHKAAEQGVPRAQNLIGDMYYKGEGVRKDFQLAMYWYLKAAEQGSDPADSQIGYMYFTGNGVTADKVEGYHWISLAVRAAKKEILRDHSEASRENYLNVKRMLKSAEPLMTPDQIRQAQVGESEWRKAHGG